MEKEFFEIDDMFLTSNELSALTRTVVEVYLHSLGLRLRQIPVHRPI